MPIANSRLTSLLPRDGCPAEDVGRCLEIEKPKDTVGMPLGKESRRMLKRPDILSVSIFADWNNISGAPHG